MTNSNDLEIRRSLHESARRVGELVDTLLVDYPALRGTLAIPGSLVGHGLGSFVANGMTDDQIVMHVLSIITEIRQTLEKELQAPS